MPGDEISIYRSSIKGQSLRQGEIISHLVQFKTKPETLYDEQPVIVPIIHPFAIVITQDCDLDWDYNARAGSGANHRLIPNILFCEVTTAESLRNTSPSDVMNSKVWSNAQKNKDERYHFLQAVKSTEDALEEGLPELAIEFRRYFTIPTEEMYKRLSDSRDAIRRRCCLLSPYLEHFSTRFAYYQLRVALPTQHESI